MKIAVLEMGLLPPQMQQRHGSFFQLIASWLEQHQQADVTPTYAQFTVCNGDALPEPQDFDAYVISGSKHGVYEQLPWMLETKAFLNRLKVLGIPMFGICFGHQLMAEAFSGKVEQSNKGWGIGVDEYELSSSIKQQVLVFHQDQVVEMPPQAQLLGGSAHCAYGALKYDFPAYSVQFHPEFTRDIILDLLNRNPEDYGQELVATAQQKTNQACLNNPLFANQVIGFFKQHQAVASER